MYNSLPCMVGLILFGYTCASILLPCLVRTAVRHNIMAYPGGRRVHTAATPLLGGAAISLPIFLVFAAYFALSFSGSLGGDLPDNAQTLSFFFGSACIFLVGLADDIQKLGWKRKLLGQLAAIAILLVGGHSIRHVTVPLLGALELGISGQLLFALVVLVIINAINLIDGLDGLAGGICLFAALTSGIIGAVKGDVFTAVIAFTLVGCLLGFLRYNFPPAAIYMGDSGSLFLGFVLGVLATSNAALFPGQRSGTMGMVFAPFLPFGIALLDVFLSVARRWVTGGKIFWPDADHLHHKLMERFRRPRIVVGIFYIFSALLSLITLCLVLGPDSAAVRVFIGVSSLVLLAVVVALLKLYRIEHLTRTWQNRPYFKYVCTYYSFMTMRLEKSESMQETLSLLESGVRDLGFDEVSVYHFDRVVEQWRRKRSIHPEAPPRRFERTFPEYDLRITWAAPSHNSVTYQKTLEITWYRFLNAVEIKLREINPPDVTPASAKRREIIKAPGAE